MNFTSPSKNYLDVLGFVFFVEWSKEETSLYKIFTDPIKHAQSAEIAPTMFVACVQHQSVKNVSNLSKTALCFRRFMQIKWLIVQLTSLGFGA